MVDGGAIHQTPFSLLGETPVEETLNQHEWKVETEANEVENEKLEVVNRKEEEDPIRGTIHKDQEPEIFDDDMLQESKNCVNNDDILTHSSVIEETNEAIKKTYDEAADRFEISSIANADHLAEQPAEEVETSKVIMSSKADGGDIKGPDEQETTIGELSTEKLIREDSELNLDNGTTIDHKKKDVFYTTERGTGRSGENDNKEENKHMVDGGEIKKHDTLSQKTIPLSLVKDTPVEENLKQGEWKSANEVENEKFHVVPAEKKEEDPIKDIIHKDQEAESENYVANDDMLSRSAIEQTNEEIKETDEAADVSEISCIAQEDHLEAQPTEEVETSKVITSKPEGNSKGSNEHDTVSHLEKLALRESTEKLREDGELKPTNETTIDHEKNDVFATTERSSENADKAETNTSPDNLTPIEREETIALTEGKLDHPEIKTNADDISAHKESVKKPTEDENVEETAREPELKEKAAQLLPKTTKSDVSYSDEKVDTTGFISSNTYLDNLAARESPETLKESKIPLSLVEESLNQGEWKVETEANEVENEQLEVITAETKEEDPIRGAIHKDQEAESENCVNNDDILTRNAIEQTNEAIKKTYDEAADGFEISSIANKDHLAEQPAEEVETSIVMSSKADGDIKGPNEQETTVGELSTEKLREDGELNPANGTTTDRKKNDNLTSPETIDTLLQYNVIERKPVHPEIKIDADSEEINIKTAGCDTESAKSTNKQMPVEIEPIQHANPTDNKENDPAKAESSRQHVEETTREDENVEHCATLDQTENGCPAEEEERGGERHVRELKLQEEVDAGFSDENRKKHRDHSTIENDQLPRNEPIKGENRLDDVNYVAGAKEIQPRHEVKNEKFDVVPAEIKEEDPIREIMHKDQEAEIDDMLQERENCVNSDDIEQTNEEIKETDEAADKFEDHLEAQATEEVETSKVESSKPDGDRKGSNEPDTVSHLEKLALRESIERLREDGELNPVKGTTTDHKKIDVFATPDTWTDTSENADKVETNTSPDNLTAIEREETLAHYNVSEGKSEHPEIKTTADCEENKNVALEDTSAHNELAEEALQYATPHKKENDPAEGESRHVVETTREQELQEEGDTLLTGTKKKQMQSEDKYVKEQCLGETLEQSEIDCSVEEETKGSHAKGKNREIELSEKTNNELLDISTTKTDVISLKEDTGERHVEEETRELELQEEADGLPTATTKTDVDAGSSDEKMPSEGEIAEEKYSPAEEKPDTIIVVDHEKNDVGVQEKTSDTSENAKVKQLPSEDRAVEGPYREATPHQIEIDCSANEEMKEMHDKENTRELELSEVDDELLRGTTNIGDSPLKEEAENSNVISSNAVVDIKGSNEPETIIKDLSKGNNIAAHLENMTLRESPEQLWEHSELTPANGTTTSYTKTNDFVMTETGADRSENVDKKAREDCNVEGETAGRHMEEITRETELHAKDDELLSGARKNDVETSEAISTKIGEDENITGKLLPTETLETLVQFNVSKGKPVDPEIQEEADESITGRKKTDLGSSNIDEEENNTGKLSLVNDITNAGTSENAKIKRSEDKDIEERFQDETLEKRDFDSSAEEEETRERHAEEITRELELQEEADELPVVITKTEKVETFKDMSSKNYEDENIVHKLSEIEPAEGPLQHETPNKKENDLEEAESGRQHIVVETFRELQLQEEADKLLIGTKKMPSEEEIVEDLSKVNNESPQQLKEHSELTPANGTITTHEKTNEFVTTETGADRRENDDKKLREDETVQEPNHDATLAQTENYCNVEEETAGRHTKEITRELELHEKDDELLSGPRITDSYEEPCRDGTVDQNGKHGHAKEETNGMHVKETTKKLEIQQDDQNLLTGDTKTEIDISKVMSSKADEGSKVSIDQENIADEYQQESNKTTDIDNLKSRESQEKSIEYSVFEGQAGSPANLPTNDQEKSNDDALVEDVDPLSLMESEKPLNQTVDEFSSNSTRDLNFEDQEEFDDKHKGEDSKRTGKTEDHIVTQLESKEVDSKNPYEDSTIDIKEHVAHAVTKPNDEMETLDSPYAFKGVLGEEGDYHKDENFHNDCNIKTSGLPQKSTTYHLEQSNKEIPQEQDKKGAMDEPDSLSVSSHDVKIPPLEVQKPNEESLPISTSSSTSTNVHQIVSADNTEQGNIVQYEVISREEEEDAKPKSKELELLETKAGESSEEGQKTYQYEGKCNEETKEVETGDDIINPVVGSKVEEATSSISSSSDDNDKAAVFHKKSPHSNILSGVGSKVKHSIAKVKKAITGGKHSNQKPHSTN